MDSGDSIMISAKVIACVDEIDCAPVKHLFLFEQRVFSYFLVILTMTFLILVLQGYRRKCCFLRIGLLKWFS